jgi:hypothetical protein
MCIQYELDDIPIVKTCTYQALVPNVVRTHEVDGRGLCRPVLKVDRQYNVLNPRKSNIRNLCHPVPKVNRRLHAARSPQANSHSLCCLVLNMQDTIMKMNGQR